MYIPKKRFWLIVASVSLILVSCILTNITFSRYEVQQNAVMNAPLGDMVYSVTKIPNNDNTLVLCLDDVYPGMSAKTYSFSVSNFSGTNYSQLPFDYTINLSTYGNLPIDITLKPNSVPSGTGVACPQTTAYFTSNNTPLSLTASGKMYINTASTTQNYTHIYNIVVEWPTSNGTADQYSGEVEYLTISTTCAQTAPAYS